MMSGEIEMMNPDTPGSKKGNKVCKPHALIFS